MEKHNILIFDEQGFFYGSTQKLLRQMAKILSQEFNVFFAYGNGKDPVLASELEKDGIKIIDNNFQFRQKREPYALVGMSPSIRQIIEHNHIHCVYCVAFAHYQFPINSIPANIPIVLISPFGHYSTNGNVAITYVSGKGNAQRLKARGASNVKLFFNPLDDYRPEILNKNPIGEKIVFGRIGRGEDSIFDPVALKAFKQLEDEYKDKVKYVVVNPPPMWKKMAEDLKIQNMEFRPPITDKEILSKFYKEIDVLAHARKDGETVGIAIAEAMLAGNPILTHKSHFHNDHFDILDKTYALWCEADDSKKYFENMKWMVEHKDQIRSMGKLARNRALEIFGLKAQAPKIIQDFKQACGHYYGNTFLSRVKGRIVLFYENFKAMPFYLGKLLTYYFPGLYKFARKFYYK